MMNTRKTMAAGVAASLGVVLCVLLPTYGDSIRLASGMVNTAGDPLNYCILDPENPTTCTPT